MSMRIALTVITVIAGLSHHAKAAEALGPTAPPSKARGPGANRPPATAAPTTAPAKTAPAAVAATGPANVNKGAKQAKGAEMMGMMINLGVAAVEAGMCASEIYPACPMAVAHAAQAAMMMQAAGGAAKTAQSSEGSRYGSGGQIETGTSGIVGENTGMDDGGGAPADPRIVDATKKIKAIQADMAAKGYAMSADGTSIKMPGGKSLPTAALSSPSGLKQYGFSEGDIEKVNAAVAEQNAKFKDMLKGFDADGTGGGGGGGRGGAGRTTAGATGSGLDFASMFAEKKKAAGNVSGLSKQLGDSKIGVPQDNIFEMVTRQYSRQEGRQAFLPKGGATHPNGLMPGTTYPPAGSLAPSPGGGM